MELSPKTIGLGIIGSLLTIAVLFGVYQMTSKPPEPTQALDMKVTEEDWVKGPKDAPNVVVEYSDLQCPACKAYQPLVKELLAKDGSKIRFVYRHFPLAQHKNALKAAMAAEAAGKQDKFWEYHEMLFEEQDNWDDKSDPASDFIAYAKKLKLDEEKFKTDMNSEELKQKIQKQASSGDALLVNSTPTFFVNGVKLDQPRRLTDFEAQFKK